jgi:hypothetical protein
MTRGKLKSGTEQRATTLQRRSTSKREAVSFEAVAAPRRLPHFGKRSARPTTTAESSVEYRASNGERGACSIEDIESRTSIALRYRELTRIVSANRNSPLRRRLPCWWKLGVSPDSADKHLAWRGDRKSTGWKPWKSVIQDRTRRSVFQPLFPQLSHVKQISTRKCRMKTLWGRHPALVDVQQRLNCALPVSVL